MWEAPLILVVIFGFVIIIVGMNIIGGIFKERVKAKSVEGDDINDDHELRLKKLEERIANIETIVLEQERDRKFSSL